ncbi:MAG: class I SAM-dependent methyltransferase [Methanosarcinales archaeon]|nr:class I SAM-dependent methyltransferase [Methanosarcinales archaeon]
MNWANEWKKLIQISSFKRGNNSPFTSKEFVDWYELQINHNEYPSNILNKILQYIDKDSTILDIGAGTGAFTIPLSKIAQEITALEPSNEMLFHLKNKLNGVNVKIINKRIEDLSIKDVNQCDIVLAAHSLYDVMDIKTELEKMLYLSKKHLIIIMGFGKSKFYNDIYQHFKGEYHPPPSFIHLYNILYEMEIPANIEIIKSMGPQVFKDKEQAINHWSKYLKLPNDKLPELQTYLSNYITEIDGKAHINLEKESAIIVCNKT